MPSPAYNAAQASHGHDHDLAVQLTYVVDVAGKMVQILHACKHSDGDGTAVARCPSPVPELLQGDTLSFLSSVLRTYPRGPTSRQALANWTAAATAFLQDHQRRQRQQRLTAQSLADAAADVAVFLSSKRAFPAPAAATAADRNTADDKGDDVPGLMEVPPRPRAKGTGAGCIGDSSSGDGCGSGSGGDHTRNSAEAATVTGLPSRRALMTAATPAGKAARSSSGNSSSKGGSRAIDVTIGGDSGAGDEGEGEAEGNARRHSGDGGDAVDGDRDEDWGATGLGSDEFSDDDAAADDLSMMPEIPTNITGVQYGGLPLVRRVLLAQLLLGWMNGIRLGVPDLSFAIEEDFARLVKQMYEIHVESVAQRAIMEYFHISKAGGTSWTSAAGLSGCQKPRANAARVRGLDDDCRWINGTLLRDLGIEIHRNSNGQEPLSRLVSNIKYMLVRLRTTLFRRHPGPELFRQLFCNASASVWEMYSPPVADNYNIRTLVGERAFHAPLHGIGEAHEAVAKKLLLQYDLVLDLNAGDAAADRVMREGLGWHKTLAEVRVWTIERLVRKSGLDLGAACALGDLTPLLVRQVYDQRWYSFGRTLSHLDQLFLSAAAHLGLKPWPQDWAQKAWGLEAGAAASADEELLGRCGLLGATQALRHVPLGD
ncbi:hypothetical protein VOLCADRAFT_103361 [Volvox carteri f. nagariensis]|uniref:Uncharacterized protein n=1 Tax=Volvox carteri f. nagariensis TaxID=3068 RepID=D8TLF0_VOLCA|nr:uncharacterized protein VOLCADRAFT_103361 [Volvox carteri f. nagariensis]EFJ51863.1 hypothetical protein VOLCADRAFT_103361 [Volvox carteri f. nagariensis]|eukprot:XP_002947273.1 hypothetical protein VOLCADRAFT_103361 [Volvox carteri f. nagariensis]